MDRKLTLYILIGMVLGVVVGQSAERRDNRPRVLGREDLSGGDERRLPAVLDRGLDVVALLAQALPVLSVPEQ